MKSYWSFFLRDVPRNVTKDEPSNIVIVLADQVCFKNPQIWHKIMKKKALLNMPPKSGTKNYTLKILISGFSQPFTQFFSKVFSIYYQVNHKMYCIMFGQKFKYLWMKNIYFFEEKKIVIILLGIKSCTYSHVLNNRCRTFIFSWGL